MADFNISYRLIADVASYVSGIGKAATSTGGLGSDQEATTATTKKLGASSAETAQNVKQLGANSGAAAKKTDALGTDAKDAAVTTKKLGTESLDTSADLEKLAAKADKASRKIDATEESTRSAGVQMQELGGKMGKLSAATAGLIVSTGKLGFDYDREFSKITGLVGIAKEEVDAMKTSTLALSGETAQAPQDLAKAMFTLQSAGLRGSDATEALAVSAKLAAGGMGEAGVIAQALTSILDQYGKHGIDAAKAADFLAATARAGNFESSQLAGGLGKVLPIASQLGINLNDVGGAVALLTRANGSATDSITQVSAVFTAMLAPSALSRKTLSDVGLSMGDVIQTAQGPGGLVAALQQLYGATGNNDEAFAGMLGSTEAIKAAFAILGADNEALAGTFGALGDSAGVAQEVFDAAAATDSFKFDKAMASLQTSAIEFAQTTAPMLATVASSVADVVSTLAGAFGSLPQPMKDFAGGLAGVTAAAAPALIGAGKLATALGNVGKTAGESNKIGGFSALKKAVGLSTPAVLGLGVALAGGVALYSHWKRAAQEAQERAESYGAALAETSGLTSDLTHLLKGNVDALTDQSEAFGLLPGEAAGLVKVFDGIGGSAQTSLESLVSVGASLRDLSDVSLGNGTPEQLDRITEAIGRAEKAGLEYDHEAFVKAIGKTGEAAAASAEKANEMAVVQRDLGREQGKWTTLQVQMATSAALRTGALNFQEVALHNLNQKYLTGLEVTRGYKSGQQDLETEMHLLRGTSISAADGLDSVKLSEKELEAATEAAISVTQGMVEALGIQASGFDDARGAASDYKAFLSGTLGPQQDLDKALINTVNQFDDLDDKIVKIGGTIDLHDEKQVAFIEQARASAAAVRDQTFAMVANGASVEDATAFQNSYAEELRNTLRDAGLAESEIDKLIATYGTLEPSKIITLHAETAQAILNVQALIGKAEFYGTLDVEAIASLEERDVLRTIGEAVLGVEEFDRLRAIADAELDDTQLLEAIGLAIAELERLGNTETLAVVYAELKLATLSAQIESMAPKVKLYAFADADSLGVVQAILDGHGFTAPVKPEWVSFATLKKDISEMDTDVQLYAFADAGSLGVIQQTFNTSNFVAPVRASLRSSESLQRELDLLFLGIDVTVSAGSGNGPRVVTGGGTNIGGTGVTPSTPGAYLNERGEWVTLYSQGYVLHDGGLVMPNSSGSSGLGLARDEVPAILQTGEFVLSRAMLAGSAQQTAPREASVSLNVAPGAIVVNGSGGASETAAQIGIELAKFERKIVNTFRGTGSTR